MAPHPLPNGLLIVFEGIDGSGKTTQLRLAQAALAQEGWPLHAARNLGGTPIGEELRKVIKSPFERPGTTNLYISVAIQEALTGAIQAERQHNKLILLDRGPLSLAAYEIYGAGLEPTLGWPHIDDGMAKLRPDLTIIYRTDVKTALERIRNKPEKADYFESKPVSFFEKVAAGYEALAKRYPGTVIIDGNQPTEAVQEQTMQAVRAALSASARS